MRTNIEINENLIREAMELSGVKTKREVVHLAIVEFVESRKRKDLRDLKGNIQFSENYDYKKLRQGS